MYGPGTTSRCIKDTLNQDRLQHLVHLVQCATYVIINTSAAVKDPIVFLQEEALHSVIIIATLFTLPSNNTHNNNNLMEPFQNMTSR